MATRFTDCEGFHRRDFLKFGAGAGLLGLTLPQLLRLEAQAAKTGDGKRKANAVIMLWLAGGPATIDMWDLKPEAPEGIRGSFKPIPTNVHGIQISEHLPQTAQIMDKATIVRSLAHTIPSHGPATVFMTTGNKPTPALQYPSLGSLVQKLMPIDKGVPPYVSFSDLRNGSAGTAGYLGTAYNPFIVEGAARRRQGRHGRERCSVRGIQLPTGISLEELENREKLTNAFDKKFKEADKSADLVDGFDAFHKQALDILRSDKTKKAFNLNEEKQETRTRTAPTRSARARWRPGVWSRLASASSPCRWAGGTRTARTSTPSRRSNLPKLDQVLSALVSDLSDRGMLDQHHRLLRRRVRPHAEDQQERRPRSLGAVDGRVPRWRRLQEGLRSRHHRCARHGPGDRAVYAG